MKFDYYCETALQPNADITKVFEDERVLAFYHTKPSYEKHIVIVSKEHIKDIKEVDEPSLLTEMMTVARDILKEYSQQELDAKGARIITNVGKFQETPHLHIHLTIGERNG